MKRSDKDHEFLVYLDDKFRVVRLSKKNDTWRYHKSWTHEEGWSSHSEEYSLEKRADGLWVVGKEFHDGRDCDGRLSQYSEYECHVNDLRKGYKGIFPKWQQIAGSQRDYSAEAMGY